MRTIIILIIALICMSCKGHMPKNYKVVRKERNYYTEKITYFNDSIMFLEKCRNGRLKDTIKIQSDRTEIIPIN